MFEYQTGSEQNTDKFQAKKKKKKMFLNDSFADNPTCYHAHITILFNKFMV